MLIILLKLYRLFPVFLQYVVNSTIHVVLQKNSLKIIKFLLKNLREGFQWENLLPVQFISAAFVNKEKIRRIKVFNLLCACAVLSHITGNACQGLDFSLPMFFNIQS